MIRTALGAVAILGLWAAPAGHAQQRTELCYSADQPASNAPLPGNATLFNCPIAGSATIGQLAARGYRVVSLSPVSTAGGSMVREQLLVELGARILANGFE